tara:strand:- start:2009 stop:4246 length:2238 start_codon:yes stop_codon:yes gene_type:complete
MFVFAQTFSPEFINNLSPEEQEQLEKIMQTNQKSDEENQTFQDVPTETLVTTQNQENLDQENNKFGYSFFNKMPTSTFAAGDLPLPNDYVISLRDRFKVILSGSKDQTFELDVMLDGSILFPELGPIQVAGKTFSQVNNTLQKLVSDSYIGVDINLSLKELSAKKITIVGAVKVPGMYVVNPFSTLTNVLAYAGGVEEYASLRNIVLRKIDGTEIIFDLYDVLIFGDRSKDVIVNAGDTILVSGTDRFVEITGEVIRPGVYEYIESDSFEDILEFSLGPSLDANLNNISYVSTSGNISSSAKAEMNTKVNAVRLDKVHVGSSTFRNEKDLFVSGSGVTTGYFKVDNENFEDFLSKLNFSSDIYPFFAVYEQELNLGMSQVIKTFSLADPNSYKNLTATKNSKITFFNRSDIEMMQESELEMPNDITLLFERLDKRSFIELIFPQKKLIVPSSGKIAPNQLHMYFGDSDSISIENVALITVDESFSDAYTKVVDSLILQSISFPSIKANQIVVEIRGEVGNPGVFTLSSSTSLDELYVLAGGTLDTSFQEAIVVTRESVKTNQMKAIKQAKTILTDSIVQKSASISENVALDINAIIEMADKYEPSGRIVGDFSSGSAVSKNFILKDNDVIIVPPKSNAVTVQGEVLNSISFIYINGKTARDYIEASGGYTSYADKNSIFVIKANGESVPISRNIFSSGSFEIEPGDTVVVPRDLDNLEALPLISMATKILSDIAFSAASINAIQN